MKNLWRSLAFLALGTLICGLVYPLAVMSLAKLLAPGEPAGLIAADGGGRNHGSAYLGQPFSAPKHLWGRPMNPDLSTFKDGSGRPLLYAWPSNLSPAGQAFAALVSQRAAQVRAAHPDQGSRPVPVDLVTSSGSGLDPHISPAAAEYQIGRLAAATGRGEAEVRAIVARYTEGRTFGLLGEPRVNVLKVNLALDGLLR